MNFIVRERGKMHNNKGKRFLIFGFIICLIVSLALGVGQVSASAPETALKKFEAYGLYNCMHNRFKRDFSQEYVADSANNYIKNMVEGTHGVNSFDATDDDYVSLPAGNNLSNVNNDKISCVHLIWNLVGSSNNENPYENFGVLLDKFGYERGDATARCVKYNFSIANVNSDGEIGTFSTPGDITYCESSVKNDRDNTIDIANSNPIITINGGGYHIGIMDTRDASKVTYCFENFSPGITNCDMVSDDQVAAPMYRNQSWRNATAQLENNIKKLYQDYFDEHFSGVIPVQTSGNEAPPMNTGASYWVKFKGKEEVSSDSAAAMAGYSYKITDPFSSFKKAYKNFFGSDFVSTEASMGFNKSQQAALYSNYIQSYWKADVQACADTAAASSSAASDLAIGNDDDSMGQFYHPTKLYKSDGSAQYCYVKATEKQGSEVYGLVDNAVGGTLNFPASSKISFAVVAKWLLDNGPDSVDPDDMAVSSSNDSGPSNSEDDPCYNAGVEGMSWILCPTIHNTADAVDGIESVLRGWLQIDTNQIFRSQTYDAWNVFRNIANALIIIVLLMIIFSQLTGVGIDNYGIKKMLPRLVIMAILINLSYIVCELAVDLSNILGVGLNNMFESIGTAIRGGNGAAAETVATIVDALLATLAGAGAAASAVITIVGIAEGGGVMLIISLVLVLLVALVAVLMFFVMLGARMVIVIMFTVIAPVAFACYILPNTQNLFKKWWKVFQAALVIFPICGALYGMSFVIKAIIFGGGDVDFMMALIAVCVPFLPFLLLPTLLRGALAGLGALGGTLTMMGNGLRKGLSSGNTALRNTDRYKNALERNAENRTRFRAGLNRRGENVEMNGFRRFVRGGDRNIARARMQYVKDQNKQSLERKMFGDDDIGFAAALTSQQKAADADMVKDYMTFINSETNNGEKIYTYEDGRQETELGRMLRSYAGSGNKFGAVAAARIAGRRKDTASDFLKNYFSDTSGYSSEIREALAREIATGENSANYRESSPFGFEFAAQINKGSKNDDESAITDYASWLGHQDADGSYDNVHRAMNNYVTNSKDLVGMKGGALKELARLMREGGIDASDAERLRGVARDAIRNRGTTGVWDSTKEQQIYEIAGLPYPPVDTSAGRRSGGSGGGNVPSGYTQTDSGLIIPH